MDGLSKIHCLGLSLLEIQNGVVAITVGICRNQQNHNFSKYTYQYYTKRGFLITLIFVLDAYKWKNIILWINSSANALYLLAKFEPSSWRWRMSRQNRPIRLNIIRSVVISALFLRSIFFKYLSYLIIKMAKTCRYNTNVRFIYRSEQGTYV